MGEWELTGDLQLGGSHFVVEADIKGFFDQVRWEWLERMLARRIADGAFINLIRKWLRAGILEEDGRVIHPQTGVVIWASPTSHPAQPYLTGGRLLRRWAGSPVLLPRWTRTALLSLAYCPMAAFPMFELGRHPH